MKNSLLFLAVCLSILLPPPAASASGRKQKKNTQNSAQRSKAPLETSAEPAKPDPEPANKKQRGKPLEAASEVTVAKPTQQEIDAGYEDGLRKLAEIEAVFRAKDYEVARSKARAALIKIREAANCDVKNITYISWEFSPSVFSISSGAMLKATNFYFPYFEKNRLKDFRVSEEVISKNSAYSSTGPFPVLDVQSVKEGVQALENSKFGRYPDLIRLFKKASYLYLSIVIEHSRANGKGISGLTSFDRQFLKKVFLEARNVPIVFSHRQTGHIAYLGFDEQFLTSPTDYELNRSLDLLVTNEPAFEIQNDSVLSEILLRNRAAVLLELVPQYATANSSGLPTVIAKLLKTRTSRAGPWGDFNYKAPDDNWNVGVEISPTFKIIKSIRLQNGQGSERWSTFDSGDYALAVVIDGKQINHSFASELAPFSLVFGAKFEISAKRSGGPELVLIQFTDDSKMTVPLSN